MGVFFSYHIQNVSQIGSIRKCGCVFVSQYENIAKKEIIVFFKPGFNNTDLGLIKLPDITKTKPLV